MRKYLLLGFLAATAIGAGGYFGLLSPQMTKNEELRDLADVIEVQNTQAQARIPVLRAELGTITSQLDELRAVASQIPATLDLPELYADLARAASRAGMPGAVTDVSVTTPMLVTAPAAEQPAEQEPVDELDPTAEPDAAPLAQPAQQSATIASFDVTMTVKGNGTQVVGFLRALKDASRLSVATATTVNITPEGEATMQLSAKYFMQEVNVDALVQQIEALRDAAGLTDVEIAPPSDLHGHSDGIDEDITDDFHAEDMGLEQTESF